MKRLSLVFAVLLATSGCASLAASGPGTPATTATMQGDAARPAQAAGWVRSELYFGVGEERGAGEREQANTISDAQWRAFLDKEVTPRFPDGLTVFDAYGQWLFRGDPGKPDPAPNRLRTKVLVILHEGTQARRDDGTGDGNIDERRWRAFLDSEVTTRFPDGLTVFDAYGQWLFRGAAEPNRLRTKVLVVLHENTPQRRADIEAIRLAWKQATGHQSVLWAQQAVEVSF